MRERSREVDNCRSQEKEAGIDPATKEEIRKGLGLRLPTRTRGGGHGGHGIEIGDGERIKSLLFLFP